MGHGNKQGNKQGKKQGKHDSGAAAELADQAALADPKDLAAAKLSKSDYLDLLEPLQIELNTMARWVQHARRRVLVIVEGRDTAGKGGVINAISETLNPRQCRTVALDKPSEREQGQWYFQRYVAQLPAAGEIVLFDRSWYNRAGVESVMGFCSPAQTQAFLDQAPIFERMLVDDGLLLFKYWLTVDQAHQEERFAERAEDPLKQWKLSPIDLQARQHYKDYGRARDRMLKATHNKHAPWTLVDFNDQRRGRLTLIRHLLDHLPDVSVPQKQFEFPPLGHAPQREAYKTKPKPLAPFPPLAPLNAGQAAEMKRAAVKSSRNGSKR
ncbi:polyphosphate kinase 2, PA0141 family [Roseateles sp. YR242]|uniref:polyphosphate kinase 2 n=1 Tax=Roseateles sp. YR242 TaxID=1855305 RepID=UPI0008BC7FDC|nr:polyphosphate kinase 2 [Roseateles sp. YR242]SEK77457.1 polyphosphate kinase 2, PA0141 family [Roseateles sp. YR242]